MSNFNKTSHDQAYSLSLCLSLSHTDTPKSPSPTKHSSVSMSFFLSLTHTLIPTPVHILDPWNQYLPSTPQLSTTFTAMNQSIKQPSVTIQRSNTFIVQYIVRWDTKENILENTPTGVETGRVSVQPVIYKNTFKLNHMNLSFL